MHAKVFVSSVTLRRTGASGVGAVLIVDGRMYETFQPIGKATHRTALRAAIDYGLMEARNKGARIVDIYIPSRVVVSQLRRGQNEQEWSNTLALLRQFEHFSVNFVANRQSRVAIALARRAAEISLKQLSTT
jgi:ribonuclease HI